MRVDVARDDGLHADRLRELPQPRVALRVAALVRPLELDEEPVAAEDRRQLGRPVAVPDREPVPRAAGQADEPLVVRRRTGADRGSGGIGSVGFGRVPACAAVRSRQRFAYPRGDSTSSVTCDPSDRDTSAPVIGRTPNAFAACANSSDPYTPSWSVSASAS